MAVSRNIRWNIRVNDGPEQYFYTTTTIYRDAAAAVPAMLGLDLPVEVKIWKETLLPDYPGFRYRIREDEFGRLVVDHLVPDSHGQGSKQEKT